MMYTNAGTSKTDLHLRLNRVGSACWELNESPAKYYIPLKVHASLHGKVYIQGICCDHTGKELSIADVSILIDKYGAGALDYLDGSFVIAVDDTRHGAWCATDHSATLPLYYKLTDSELIITTRAENLNIDKPDELDLAGIISTLNTGYPWGGLTLHKAWKVLRPGQVMILDRANDIVIKNYFLAEEDPDVPGFTSPEELLNEIDAGLISLSSRYKKLLIPLSGGVDSRLITMECHKLGIPFEAITFVANVPDGDDFDIASRLVKIYGVKHHRWEWAPSADTLDNFMNLCSVTGGTNDAYTTYPDGMKVFAKIASEFDCVLRGDHSFGYGCHSESLFQSAYDLCINYKEDLNWALMPAYQNKVNLESIFEEHELVSAQLKGIPVNEWRHRSRRLTRNPRAHLPIGQLQAGYATIAYPLLTRNIVKRMARTETTKKNNKLIAHEALAIGSPPDIKRIPHSNRHTWQTGEPLLNLPRQILREMADTISKPGILSDIIDEIGVVDRFTSAMETGSRGNRPGVGKSVRRMIKKLLPERMIHSYKDRVSYPKTPPHMVFKRLFAAKVFIDATSKKAMS